MHLNLNNIFVHTALLEACDWNEQKLESAIRDISLYLSNLVVADSSSWINTKYNIQFDLQNMVNKQVSAIIMNEIKLARQELLTLMELPE